MKIYDKRLFRETVLYSLIFLAFELLAVLLKTEIDSYTPSLFILWSTYDGIAKSLLEEKAKENMKKQRLIDEIIHKTYGNQAKLYKINILLSNIFMVFSIFRLTVDTKKGLFFVILAFINQYKINKPINEELKRINDEENNSENISENKNIV